MYLRTATHMVFRKKCVRSTKKGYGFCLVVYHELCFTDSENIILMAAEYLRKGHAVISLPFSFL